MESFFGWMLESSLLVLMLLGIRKAFMGRIRYAGIYALWLVILVRFMIPVNVISTPFSVGNVFSQAVSSWSKGEASEQAGSAGGLSAQGRQQSDGEKSTQAVSSENTSVNQRDFIAVMGRESLSNQNTLAEQRGSRQNLISDQAWQKICQGRTVISGILFLWLFLSNLCLLNNLKRDRILYGRRGRVKIYASHHIKNPCLYGFFRPVIYIPRALALGEDGVRAEEGELEQIITHEYVHYLHKDHIWAMLRMLLVSVYWYHPFLWLAVSYSKKDAELFCDETVIGMLGEEKRFSYGEMLVRLAGEARWGDFRYSLMPMSRRGKEMEKRIRAISDRKKYSKWVLLPLLLVVSVTAGITCSTGTVPLARNHTETRTQGEEKQKKAQERGEGKTGEYGDISPGGVEELFSSYSEYVKKEAVGKSQKKGQENLLNYNTGVVFKLLETRDAAQGEEASAINKTGLSAVYSTTYREAFMNYIEIFTEAVNTGNTENMHLVLAAGTQVYEQQCALARNYYKRGIREKVRGVTISSVECDVSMRAEIVSREKIKVFYGDGTSKIVRQQYQYTCENIDGNWMIVGMDEILNKDD